MGILFWEINNTGTLTATNDWLEMMESGIEAAAVFFDFTKAFDSVPHKPLIEKL